jgi:hypothetical protein
MNSGSDLNALKELEFDVQREMLGS